MAVDGQNASIIGSDNACISATNNNKDLHLLTCASCAACAVCVPGLVFGDASRMGGGGASREALSVPIMLPFLQLTATPYANPRAGGEGILVYVYQI